MERGWRGQPGIQDAWEAGCLGNGEEQQNAHQNHLSTRGDFFCSDPSCFSNLFPGSPVVSN